MRRAIGTGLALGGIALGVYLLRPAPTEPVSAPAPAEGCLTCHTEPRESPGGIHALLAGCEACHLGDPTARTEEGAHRGLELEPGALDTAAKTCGRGGCHPAQLERVETSLMATARGLIAVDRWAFGEHPVPTSTETAQDILREPAPSPAQDHLRKLCLGCHLGARKDNRDDMLAGTASGCSACHSAPRATPEAAHPFIDREPPDQRCFGCHSRSARVSLSYKGWAEVRGPDAKTCEAPVTLEDGRTVCDAPKDVHAEAGLACVDCHLHTELMGDGVAYAHEEQQVEVRCESCHGPAAGLETTWGAVQDATSQRLLALAKRAVQPQTPARTGRRGTPLWNVVKDAEGWRVESKLGAGAHRIPQTPADIDHQRPGHERLSCAACHTAWAPTCPTCHTGYAPEQEQWDFGRAAVVAGRWVERAERYLVQAPVLARRGERIVPAAPGMIAQIDARAAGGGRRAGRWFSAFDPHTTAKESRPCASCHEDPSALGLGRGELKLGPAPRFRPADGGRMNQANANGWQPLFPEIPGFGTRPEVRGLDRATQWRMLRVGACAQCHSYEKDSIFLNFSKALQILREKKARSCRGWDHRYFRALPPGTATIGRSPGSAR